MGIMCGNKWTSVKKSLPPEPKSVDDIKPYIVTCKGFVYPIALSYMGDGSFQDINGHDELYDVIAWMPMPPVYKPRR